MSTTITEAHVQQYFSNVWMRAQQKVSKLRNLVEVKPAVVGKTAFFDRIGRTEMEMATTRHADTPLMDTPHSRRRASLQTWRWADLVDKDDEVKVLQDPESNYAIAGSYAAGRRIDRILFDAALGTAATGEDGAGSETWPVTATSGSSHQIAHGGVGLTLAKINQAAKLLNLNDVEMENRVFVYSPDALEDILGDATITSADHNTVKLLMRGEINTFMGFEWVMSTLLAKSGTTRSLIAYQRMGLGLAIGADVDKRITERDDKNYSTQVWFQLVMGAVRIDSDRVVEVQITE